MRIIDNNPYRQLGVFSNSPTKERVANLNRLKAFLNVGRQVSFPLDLPEYLPIMERTAESVKEADAKLTLPKDQIGYAQFWFVKSTPLDNIAFNNLFAGKTDDALSIWNKKDNVSSLQNRIVFSLILKDYANAIACAEKLYVLPEADIVTSLLGANTAVQTDSLALNFLDTLCNEVGIDIILPKINNVEWQQHVKAKAVQPLIAKIQDAVDSSKATKNKGADARLQAGNKLMRDAGPLLTQLRKLLPMTDIQYQLIADKLGNEILQCGIDYYNGSDESDRAYKAMKLQEYALKIVVGKMAKERCEENVRILKDIISKLPPMEVISNHQAIQFALKTFATQPNLIKYSVELIKNCAPHIVAIKEKLGRKHQYYLKISTIIVNNALGNVISEVNESQKKDFGVLKATLISAWRTQLYMDMFDMELSYKVGRYKECRSVLKTVDIRSPKTGISVHFSVSLSQWRCKKRFCSSF